MIEYVILTFLISLGLTLVLELPIAVIFKARKKDFLLFILVNILTNPLVVYFNMVFVNFFPNANIYIWQIPLEILAIVTEGAIYKRYGENIKNPWILGLIANLFSYAVGIIINGVI